MTIDLIPLCTCIKAVHCLYITSAISTQVTKPVMSLEPDPRKRRELVGLGTDGIRHWQAVTALGVSKSTVQRPLIREQHTTTTPQTW